MSYKRINCSVCLEREHIQKSSFKMHAEYSYRYHNFHDTFDNIRSNNNTPNKKIGLLRTFDNKTIRTAVSIWVNHPNSATEIYGHISDWDVSNVTDMSWLFAYSSFNQDISNWNVSNVTDMSYMFKNATRFNQDISDWDVSNVTNMEGMFCDAYMFNQNISSWDVSKVTNMVCMFYNAYRFNQVIIMWNISDVTDVDAMFIGAKRQNRNYMPYKLKGWFRKIIHLFVYGCI